MKARLQNLALGTGCLLIFAMGLIFGSITNARLGDWFVAYFQSPIVTNANADILAAQATSDIAWWTRLSAFLGMTAMVAVYLAYKAYVENKRSANAAMELNRISRTSHEIQSRAYLGLLNPRLVPQSGNAELDFKIDLKNFGRTPAKNIRVMLKIICDETEFKDRLYFFKREVPAKEVILNPAQKMWFGKTLRFRSNSSYEPLSAGELRFSCGILISYEDIFGKRHLIAERAILDHERFEEGKKAKLLTVSRREGL